MRENGYGGGDESCEEGENEDRRSKRGERGEYKSFFHILDSLWAERLPQRPGGNADPCNQQLYGLKISAGVPEGEPPSRLTNVGSTAVILSSLSTHRSCMIPSSLQESLVNNSPKYVPRELTMEEKSCHPASRSSVRWMLCRSLLAVVE